MAAIRKIVEILLMVIGLLALPVAWMLYRDDGLKRAAEPPWRVRTLDDFRKWRPQYDRAAKLESGGAVFYLIYGENARTLASGPSGYLFDARGNLVSWILDTGDNTYSRVATDSEARKGALGAAQIVIESAPAAEPKK